MLENPTFWVFVALLIFFGIVWKVGGFQMMAKALDGRAERVKAELAEAKALREEAQALLADYTRKRKEAEAEAEAIVAAAKTEAERMKAETLAKVNDFVARRTRMAEQKIAQAEAQAIAEVRSTAADVAVAAAASLLAGESKAGKLMDAAIADVKARLN